MTDEKVETPRTKREFREAVIAELNLDVKDPFTSLLANALATLDQRDTLRAELERVKAERDDFLIRNGFVRCDIAACNCGSWHHRYGLPERMAEIRRSLIDAGVLNNDTGNLPILAIAKLIERAAAAEQENARLREQLAAARAALSDCPTGYDEYGVYAEWRRKHAAAIDAATGDKA